MSFVFVDQPAEAHASLEPLRPGLQCVVAPGHLSELAEPRQSLLAELQHPVPNQKSLEPHGDAQIASARCWGRDHAVTVAMAVLYVSTDEPNQSTVSREDLGFPD